MESFATLRSREFARLDRHGHAYLDYTGAALYARSQVERHHRRLLEDVLGNPHSEHPASRDSSVRMESARRRVLEFLHADAAEWTVVFTANATAALRLVGESFPFGPRSPFVLTRDNHNSVHGIRCFARRAGAAVRYVPLDEDLRALSPWPQLPAGRGLFAFPAQSNFTGVRHPLAWIDEARGRGWATLLDAAAFAPASPLDLRVVRPDFLCLSFYKMFGFPTGIGALVARRDALAQLVRPWFAGGTVEWVSTVHGTHAARAAEGAFEDGTPSFLAFDAVLDGLEFLETVGMERIHDHVHALTRRLLRGLQSLRGGSAVVLYGPADDRDRGGTVAFNVRGRDGAVIPFDDTVARAAENGVSVRGGCFCNPGAAEAAFGFEAERTRRCLDALGEGFTPRRFAACLGAPAGAVRASVGLPTVPEDIDRLLDVVARLAGGHRETSRLSGRPA